MSTSTVKFTPEVAAILRAATLTSTSLTLNGQLSRDEYKDVMKVIDAAGGSWNKKLKCHTFSRDPRDIFADALDNGSVAKLAIVDEKKERQAYYTPTRVVDYAVEVAKSYLTITPEDILEPSAGEGRIARALVFAFPKAKVSICEIDDAERAKAAEWGSVIGTDFLAVKPEPKFDLIVMNPPFSKSQDEAHILHASKFLRPRGVLVAICTPMTGRRDNKKSKEFAAAIGDEADRRNLPEGAFKESGTGVNTILLIHRA